MRKHFLNIWLRLLLIPGGGYSRKKQADVAVGSASVRGVIVPMMCWMQMLIDTVNQRQEVLSVKKFMSIARSTRSFRMI